MPENNTLRGRHVVHTVFQFFGGAQVPGGKFENFTAKPTAISVVSDDEAKADKQRNQEGLHTEVGI